MKTNFLLVFYVMAKQSDFIKRELFKFIEEEYTSVGEFSPPNPEGVEISVGKYVENGDDQDMERELQADIGAQPILAIDENVRSIENPEEIIDKVLNNLGIHEKPHYEGKGTMGIAYSVGDKIYKITTDNSEAAEAIKLKGKQNKYLADVYNVYDLNMSNTKERFFVIVSEKLRTDYVKFGELLENIENVFNYNLREDIFDLMKLYRDHRDLYNHWIEKIKLALSDYPEERNLWQSILYIIDELKQNNIKSLDIVDSNLGYKKNGKIGFFDFGYSDEKVPKTIDTLTLENQIFERLLTYMPNASMVSVKKKCQLGGNGDGTSTACNQGDVNALDIKKLSEAKETKIEYGALMVFFDIDNWNEVTSMVDKDDIYDKPSFGIEDEPHLTLLYGFHTDVKVEEVQKIIESIIDISKPLKIELNKVSSFETNDYDVVKFDVVLTDTLSKLNKALKKLPHTSNFPDYHPHVTISYVKKGTGKKYGKKFKKNIKLQSDKLVFSSKKDGKAVLKVKKSNLNENKIPVNSLPFKSDIESAGGKIYSVGGAVRDDLLKRESKDLDLLITGVPLDVIEQILSKYGRVDNVGKSFGILKFNTPETGELDIAIPRTEKATGEGGYQGFDVTSDHSLPIEKDLERRDFTINAIAKDSNGNTIDPYNGTKDIQDKVIRMVNPKAFSEDPLRMLRALQFSSRFGFEIEPETMKAIQQNASKIREISPERILIEFQKIVDKGSPTVGADLLIKTGLYQNIFSIQPKINVSEFQNVKTMGEFIYQLIKHGISNPAEFYKNNLKGDIDTFNEIKALEMAFKDQSENSVTNKLTVYSMYKTFPNSINSEIIPDKIKKNIKEMRDMNMPFSLRELQVNGNDLLPLGFSGMQIGQILKNMLIDVYSGKQRNNKELLLRQLVPIEPKI